MLCFFLQPSKDLAVGDFASASNLLRVMAPKNPKNEVIKKEKKNKQNQKDLEAVEVVDTKKEQQNFLNTLKYRDNQCDSTHALQLLKVGSEKGRANMMWVIFLKEIT